MFSGWDKVISGLYNDLAKKLRTSIVSEVSSSRGNPVCMYVGNPVYECSTSETDIK